MMRTSRRKFISTSVAGGLAASLPFYSCGPAARRAVPAPAGTDYSRLDEILKTPVFRRKLFSSPVIIGSLELMRYKDSFLCRVRSLTVLREYRWVTVDS